MNETWNMTDGDPGFGESISQILEINMNSCYKSAVILCEDMAHQLYTILKANKKPTYLGKDIKTEDILLLKITLVTYFTFLKSHWRNFWLSTY